jgi:hypothetical protein
MKKIQKMPILEKWHWYRHRKNKDGVDVIPTEDIEVTKQTYDQYIEVKR